MGILFNAFDFIFRTTEGYGTAASTRVSNGEGHLAETAS